LYSKSSGKWDIWKLINKGDNINNNINLTNKNWKINFLDYHNNELNLGKDDIKINNINDYNNGIYDNTNLYIETNIESLLIPSNHIIDNPIKFNGVYKIQVMLHPEIFVSVLVVVAKSDSEAQDALSEYKEAKNKKSESDKEQASDLV
jgi:hypothetical protein